MNAPSPEKNIDFHSKSIPRIYIIGKNKLENELLLLFLEKEMKLPCKHFSDLKAVGSTKNDDSELTQCLLIDSNGIDIKNLWHEIVSWKKTNGKNCLFALYNVNPDTKIEKSALAKNIKGIFYKNQHPETIPKGLFAVLNGELWYSRKILQKGVLKTDRINSPEEYNCTDNILSSREKQVLSLIASGYKNKDIADYLSVSLNTVKAHIYNIYEKINVNNRLQAILWAVRYLTDGKMTIRQTHVEANPRFTIP